MQRHNGRNDKLWEREREREISAFVALICLQQRKPFIAIRALSDLAGGDSSESNELTLIIMVKMINYEGHNYFV